MADLITRVLADHFIFPLLVLSLNYVHFYTREKLVLVPFIHSDVVHFKFLLTTQLFVLHDAAVSARYNIDRCQEKTLRPPR